jgi:hypothetical protein
MMAWTARRDMNGGGTWRATAGEPADHPLAGSIATAVAFICGLALPFNIILQSSATRDLRLLDLLGVALVPLAVWACLRRIHLLLAMLLLGLVFVLPFLVHAVILVRELDDYADFEFPVRFLLALSFCATLTPLLENTRHRSVFAAGLCLGCCLCVIPLVFQSLGQNDTMVAIGLAPSRLAIPPWQIQQRPPGLHGHANATSAVISLGIPVATFMAVQQRRFWLLPCAVAALLACSYYTETRSAVGISLATMGFALALGCRTDRILLLLPAVALAGVLAAGFIEGPLLPASFLRTDTADANLGERFATTTTGMLLVLEHPLGLGRSLGEAAVYQRTGTQAFHNALIWLGVAAGLVPMVFTAGVLLAAATQAGRQGAPGLRGLLAFHLLGLCLFEDHFQNPTFILVLILVAGGWLNDRLGGDGAPRALQALLTVQATPGGHAGATAAVTPRLAARSDD